MRKILGVAAGGAARGAGTAWPRRRSSTCRRWSRPPRRSRRCRSIRTPARSWSRPRPSRRSTAIEATGTKANAAAQLEMVIREAQASNVQGDVMQISDVAAGVAQLLPEGFVDELGAARSRRQDRPALPGPAGHRQRGERLGLQHPGLRRVPDREHLAADRAGVEGQGRAAGSARQGVLHRLVQPDGDAWRRSDRRGLRGALRQAARDRRGEATAAWVPRSPPTARC